MADPTKAATLTAKMNAPAFTLETGQSDVDYIRMILYGVPGCGKTTLAATACNLEEMSDVLLIDAEEGKLVIKRNKRIKNPERITRVRVSSFDQIAAVHKFLKAHCRHRDNNDIAKLRALQSQFQGAELPADEAPKKFNTVIIDTLTEVNQLCLYKLMGYATDMNLGEVIDGEGDADVATFAEYKKNNLIMQLIVRSFRDLPINCIFTCHQSFVQDEVKRMFFAPSLTGKLATQIQGFVDVVGYLKAGKATEGAADTPRRLYVQPVGNFDAKSRLASLKEPFIDDAYMADLWKIFTAAN